MVTEITDFGCLLDSRKCGELVKLSSECICELIPRKTGMRVIELNGDDTPVCGDRVGPKEKEKSGRESHSLPAMGLLE